MPINNQILKRQKQRRVDEYFTRYQDIEDEVVHYKDHLKGKNIYCNCDTPSSNFIKYFTNNFQALGIKSLIATGYKEGGKGNLYTYDGKNVAITELQGDGSFDSQECIDLLNQCDILITNPPFSKYLKFWSVLEKSGKDFLLVGTILNFTNSTAQGLFSKGFWAGVNRIHLFYVPDDFVFTNPKAEKTVDGKRAVGISNTCWITNMTPDVKNSPIPLTVSYDPKTHPRYECWPDIVFIDKLKNIPKDYYDEMAVPVNYWYKHCPDQFEILGYVHTNSIIRRGKGKEKIIERDKVKVNGKAPFVRILIKRKIQP